MKKFMALLFISQISIFASVNAQVKNAPSSILTQSFNGGFYWDNTFCDDNKITTWRMVSNKKDAFKMYGFNVVVKNTSTKAIISSARIAYKDVVNTGIKRSLPFTISGIPNNLTEVLVEVSRSSILSSYYNVITFSVFGNPNPFTVKLNGSDLNVNMSCTKLRLKKAYK